jgi:peptide/nickel transport system permease protein
MKESRSMGRYIAGRLLALVPILIGISMLVFLMMALIPGDPAQAILGPYATDENLAELRRDLALDRSLPTCYLAWMNNVMHGDLGTSYSLNRPVLDELKERLGPTLLLAGTSFVVCVVLGLGAGVLSSVRQSEWPDRLIGLLVLLGISTPSFWLSLLFVALFCIQLGWFPASGMFSVYKGGGLTDLMSHLVLPSLTLAMVASGVVARLMRTGMLEVLRQDYIRTARAKGMKESRVICWHALRNAIVGMVPVLGIQAGFLIGGAVYVETVFQWPGIGRMLVMAIQTRDLLLVQGAVLVLATGYVLFNLLADVLQHLLDPRLRT